MYNDTKIHATADVDHNASVGRGTSIWNWVQIRENAKIGQNCILSKGVYIDAGVKIGDNVKIQNNVSIYYGVIVEDGVFIGPHVCFTNDKLPRAINKDGVLKSGLDREVSKILVKYGSSIGANTTICPGVTIGKYALIGSGSVVTKNIPDFALVYGNPAKVYGRVDEDGNVLERYF